MSTNRKVIDTALRMLNVLDADQTATAEDAALCLGEMNDLFERMSADGIDLGYSQQTNVSDEFPLDSTTEALIKPILATSLLDYYPSAKPISSLPMRTEQSMSRLRVNAVVERVETASMTNIPLGSANYGRYSILTDN